MPITRVIEALPVLGTSEVWGNVGRNMAKFSHLCALLCALVGGAAFVGALLIAVPASAHAPGPNFTQAVDLGTTTEWGKTGVTSEPTDIPEGEGWRANYFKVRVVARGPLSVWTSGGFSPELQVFDQSEMPIGEEGSSRRRVSVPRGIAYVRARSRSEGRYRLHVAGGGIGHDDIPNWSGVAAPLPSCLGLAGLEKCKPQSESESADKWDARQTLNLPARLDFAQDWDWFKFDVPEGASVPVRMWSSGGTDTYGELWSTRTDTVGEPYAEERLETNDDSGDGGNFFIDRPLDPGTFLLGVTGSGDATGAYRLHLGGLDDHGNFWGTESRVQLPTDPGGLPARIDYGDDWDGFWFQVSKPGNVQIRATGDGYLLGVLYDAFQIQLELNCRRNIRGCVRGGFHIERRLDPGIYYIWVTDTENTFYVSSEGHSVGPYNLHLSGDASGVLTVPLVPANGNARGQQGFVRVINHSDQPAEVGITAVDDTGMRHELSSQLQLAEWQTLHFNSQDLEQGNPDKGIADGVGSGMGNWYLEVAPSRPEVEVLSYIRTEDGFLTSMHTQPPSYGRTHRLATFNPGSNRNQASRLRLINLRCPQSDISGCEAANVTIYGVDDKGKRSPDVRLAISPGAVREVTAAELEGLAQNAEGLEGSLGDGGGKWQLFVSSDLPIQVISMLESVSGHLTNLSAPASDQRFSAPARE